MDARHLAARAAGLLASVVLLAGCAGILPPPSPEMAPWKTDGGVIITSAPDAGGPLSFRNCPTLAEAQAAIPALAQGPDANAVPFKTMVLQCSYSMNEPDIQGWPAGVDILVFDASADGQGDHLWDSVRADRSFPNPTDVPGLADVAFATGTAGNHDLWVVQGRYGLHMYDSRRGGIPLDQMVALARAMLAGLERAPR